MRTVSLSFVWRSFFARTPFLVTSTRQTSAHFLLSLEVQIIINILQLLNNYTFGIRCWSKRWLKDEKSETRRGKKTIDVRNSRNLVNRCWWQSSCLIQRKGVFLFSWSQQEATSWASPLLSTEHRWQLKNRLSSLVNERLWSKGPISVEATRQVSDNEQSLKWHDVFQSVCFFYSRSLLSFLRITSAWKEYGSSLHRTRGNINEFSCKAWCVCSEEGQKYFFSFTTVCIDKPLTFDGRIKGYRTSDNGVLLLWKRRTQRGWRGVNRWQDKRRAKIGYCCRRWTRINEWCCWVSLSMNDHFICWRSRCSIESWHWIW